MLKILFICTHNRCRSILAEAISRHASTRCQLERNGQATLDVRSAGSHPEGVVFPGTLTYLERQGISTEGLVSQSWDDLEEFAPDIVITVCDNAAGETCPLWMGKAAKVHWGLPDPSKLADEAMQQGMFDQVGRMMKQRLTLLAQTPLDEFTEREAMAAAVEQLLTPERFI
jgi:arsenate reductase